jgi:hypothetical protein
VEKWTHPSLYILVKEKEKINGFMFESKKKKKSEKWVY